MAGASSDRPEQPGWLELEGGLVNQPGNGSRQKHDQHHQCDEHGERGRSPHVLSVGFTSIAMRITPNLA